MKTSASPASPPDSPAGWLFRLVKGIVIGTGFIIPGVSGGVFAAIFGVYERMIRFFANITKDFKANVLFFLPIGIGGILSMILSSKVLHGFFQMAEVPLVWFFIGCVAGTAPLLVRQAAEKGRRPIHVAVFVIAAGAGILFLYFIKGILKSTEVPVDHVLTWLLAGALMGLGAIVPGLSPSNFLVFMGIYDVMMDRVGSADPSVLFPVLGGAGLCFIGFSKAMDRLFDRAYAGIYHTILGVILASTVMIVPINGRELENGDIFRYTLPVAALCVLTCLGGAAVGYGMGILEKKYK